MHAGTIPPLPADRAVFKRLILAFVEMFLSPLDDISILCGLAFPAVWGYHHVEIGMLMRDLCGLSPQGCTGHSNAREMGPLHPTALATSSYRRPQCYVASKHKVAQLSPGWAEHTWEPYVFSQGGRRGPKEGKE